MRVKTGRENVEEKIQIQISDRQWKDLIALKKYPSDTFLNVLDWLLINYKQTMEKQNGIK